MNQDNFNLFTAPLHNLSLIEASAGTGKTFTISGLYLRLVLEAERRADQILVVTFTNAATQELKDRIRKRLLTAHLAFANSASDDLVCQQLLQQYAGPQQRDYALRRLQNALRGFDEAAIFTIHSFCQRVLADQAFASGMPFETELQTDVSALLKEISEDFWRLQFYQASPLLVRYLLERRYSPAQLLAEVKPHLGKPYLQVQTIVDEQQHRQQEHDYAQAFSSTRAAWLQHRDEVIALLQQNKTLNANKYRNSSLTAWFIAMDEFCQPKQAHLAVFEAFKKFSQSQINASVKRGQQPPKHLFFQFCDTLWQTYSVLTGSYQQRLKAMRITLLDYLNQELKQRKKQQQLQSYDDLLSNLHQALHSPHGAALANSIRKRYPAALIDEFQDTDPQQYEIFRAIYAQSDLPVFFVGDPKQAIYSFRGADVFAYLRARDAAQQIATLAYNWRSDATLINAVNTLFLNCQQPFLLQNIPFQAVQAAPDSERQQQLKLTDADSAPLQIWFCATDDEQRLLNKGEAQERIATATAAEIVALLRQADAGKATLGERRLNGGDIAILVRTHRQGTLMREALLKLGVPSVQHAQDNVFHSHEAEQLEHVLQACAEPGREALVVAALASQLLGFNATELFAWQHDEITWERLLQQFHDHHQVWREQGFTQLSQRLLHEHDIARRLLSWHDGERRLTNLLHLFDLLQNTATQQHLGVEGLLQWFSEERLSLLSDNQEYQLRLESDALLVQIITVHKSKGLEYPIVFCPFLWDGRLRSEKAEIFSYHDPDQDYQAVVDFGSTEQEQRRPQAKNEELAENLRLLYVALTRAKQRCYLVCGRIRDAEISPLAWLFHTPSIIAPNSDLLSATAERFLAMTATAMRAEIEPITRQSTATIQLSSLPEPDLIPYQVSYQAATDYQPRQFTGSVSSAWRISSFTALTSQHSAELPDHDRSNWSSPAAVKRPVSSIFDFPRGARAGSCMHYIFEHWEFTNTNHDELTRLCEDALLQYGFATDWSGVLQQMVVQVLASELSPAGPVLHSIPPSCRLTEVEFYYPANQINATAIKQILLNHGTHLQAYQQDIDALTFAQFSGFMKGYIDLVFQAQNRFYIVDYKSNWLGESWQDYQPEYLHEAIARDFYYLQYLIYSIALHRYLQLRLPGYCYEKHFGGVYYLFLRGIDLQHPGNGIFAQRPEPALIYALDQYLNNS